nr:uncharacterized protein LOC111839470 isoform X3 [Paramormyrops kingsleyae]
MPTQENLSELATELQSRIPECLDDLSESPQNILLHNKCIGAIATYVFVNTGHRYSVVINMLPQEVTKVQVSGDKVVIHVKDHKTAGSFGRVNMALSKKEYQWLHQFAQLRCELPGFRSLVKTFFFTSSGKPFRKLNDTVMDTCLNCGMPKAFTMSQLRSGVLTCIERGLPEDQRRLVSHMMCHSVETADRFYVAEPELAELHVG